MNNEERQTVKSLRKKFSQISEHYDLNEFLGEVAKLLSEKDAEIQRLKEENADLADKGMSNLMGIHAMQKEIQRLKEQLDWWKNDRTEAAGKISELQKEIQRLKEATEYNIRLCNKYFEEIQQLKEAFELQSKVVARQTELLSKGATVEQIEAAWDACHIWLLWEFGRLTEPAPNKSEYLQQFKDK